ncbi:cytochrome P450 [Favolaschia claudopus]|uniref:Cytochrome P450 n=1 Tax=Favolaschia claudopus TaxID=2862362 RepID=A0AAW0BSY2_9AGAR
MSYRVLFLGLNTILGAYYLFLRRRRNTVRNIIGPPSPSWVFGHSLQLVFAPEYGDYEFLWQKMYGPLYRLKGCFGANSLVISDPVALQHIVNSPAIEHGPVLENIIELLFGKKSVVSTKGEAHKHFRAAMNAGFSASAVRDLQPALVRAAQELIEELQQTSATPATPVNLSPRLSNATLNAVLQAGLGCSPADLSEELLGNNWKIVSLSSSQSAPHIFAIGACMPKWVWTLASKMPTATFKVIRSAKNLTERLGEKVVQNKRDLKRQGMEINTDVFGVLMDQYRQGKSKHTLNWEEIAAQTSAILFPGQDPTANTLAFGLWELAKHPEFQEELRAEIHSNTPAIEMCAYDTMPLLNAFIKVLTPLQGNTCVTYITSLLQEVLRLYPAAALIQRIAVEDTVIPLANPIITASQQSISHVPVQKGQVLTLAVASYQRLEQYWGEDAQKFRPSRWIDGTLNDIKAPATGPYANLMSFLGGPRVCLGWRFAVLELQVFFCELVRNLYFSLPEDESVRMRFSGSLIPVLPTGEKGMPLSISRV